MSVFEIKNARKSFGDLEVLKDISVSVEKGEIVSFYEWAVEMAEKEVAKDGN
jgi:ABC-type histidine transport system ATPase subunit